MTWASASWAELAWADAPAVAGGTEHALLGTTGSYTVTGSSAGFKVNKSLLGATGSYAITGNFAAFNVGKKLLGASGPYAIAGNSAVLLCIPGPSVTAYAMHCADLQWSDNR